MHWPVLEYGIRQASIYFQISSGVVRSKHYAGDAVPMRRFYGNNGYEAVVPELFESGRLIPETTPNLALKKYPMETAQSVFKRRDSDVGPF